MLRQLSTWLHHMSTGRVALAALVISLSFMVLVLPGQSASASQQSGGAGSPDTSFVYSADDLYRMAEAYGQQGREYYVKQRFTFDLAFPIVYTLFLTTAISWLSARGFAPGSLWQRANLAPLAGALFDYLENISTSLVMLRYPLRTPVVASLAPFLTLVKWIFVIGSFVLLLVALAAAIRRWLARPTT